MTAVFNSRVLLSIGVIVAVSAALISATGAFFSDSETSTGNTFAAGTLDLSLQDWDEINATASAHTAFDVQDMMPGATGEKSIVVESTADAWAKIEISNPVITDGGVTGSGAYGDLWDELLFTIEGSDDNSTWTTFVTDEPIPSSGLTVYSATYNEYMDADQPYYIRVSYELPEDVDNSAQGDEVSVDVTFTAKQYENNTDASANQAF